jgi:hypothetical protein
MNAPTHQLARHSDADPLLSGIIWKSPSPLGRRVGMREALASRTMISKPSLTLALSQKERELNPGGIRVGFCLVELDHQQPSAFYVL